MSCSERTVRGVGKRCGAVVYGNRFNRDRKKKKILSDNFIRIIEFKSDKRPTNCREQTSFGGSFICRKFSYKKMSDCRQSGARTVVLAPFFLCLQQLFAQNDKKSILSSLSYRFF